MMRRVFWMAVDSRKGMTGMLSVVIPVYNAENFIRRALESVLSQSYAVHEIICVDDGSTDGSADILKEYADRDERIKVLRKDNGGSTSARKAGVIEAQGTYITFVDADDFIEPNMYEEMMSMALKYDADLVTSGLIRDYGDSCIVNHEKLERGVYTAGETKDKMLCSLIDTQSFYKTSISPSLCNKIFRAEKLQAVQMNVDDRVIVGDDDAVIYPFLFEAQRVVVSGKSYYHYCIRESGSNLGVRRENDLEAYQILFSYLETAFRKADKPGLNLIKQFQVLKTYFLLLKFPTKVLKYNGEILYPFGRLKKETKILLYGAGKFGVEMKKYLEGQGFQIVGWVDKSAKRPEVIRPDEMNHLEFSCLIITVLISDAVEQIKEELEQKGIPDEKIICVNVRMVE